MDKKKKAFNKAVRKAAMQLARKKLFFVAASSATLAVGIMGIATSRLLDSISTDDDWSAVDWAIDSDDELF